MKKNLQQELKKEFETPETPFDEWAEKHGVFKNGIETVDCPVYIPADNVNGRGMPSANRKRVIVICSAVFAFLVIFAIILASVLIRPAKTRIYGADDAENVKIELQEIIQKEDIFLFDTSVVVKTQAVSKDVLIKDNSQVMSYTLFDCLLSVENGEGYDGFYVTYKIRTYSNYEFVGFNSFSELNKDTTVNNLKIEYKIDTAVANPTAYAKFSLGSYEYFIEARGYQPLTTVTEDNFLNLLDKILI